MEQLLLQLSFLGLHGFSAVLAPSPTNGFPQNTMTNDPQKVWPGGIIPYLLQRPFGEFSLASIAEHV